MRRRAAVGVALGTAMLCGLAGCGPRSSDPSSHPDARQGSSPISMPCAGISTTAQAADLIRGGESVALVEVTITEAPLGYADGAQLVPVASAILAAGTLANGDLETIEEASDGQDNLLPPGAYLVLVGETPNRGSYFLSDGYRGSFSLSHGAAHQRCPDDAHPGAPVTVGTGETRLPALAALFAAGFRSRSATRSPATSRPSQQGSPDRHRQRSQPH